MRNELELMEQIERYLNGTMSSAERDEFIQQLDQDRALRSKMEMQRNLMGGLNRIALKQEVVRAGRQYHLARFLRWTIGGATIAAIVVAVLIVRHYASHASNPPGFYVGTTLPDLNEEGKKEWASADSLIPAQAFTINSERDTAIETRQGIVMAIPAHAFVTNKGKVIGGTVNVYIKEAMDPFTIMRAGLSTQSGDRLLETGGMFFIDARQENSILQIDPAKPVYASVPTDDVKGDMQLFHGKRMPDGSIDWINPEPIAHDLMVADIMTLDFYPPGYLSLLQKNNYPTSRKQFTDSVYYSQAALFVPNVGIVTDSNSRADTAQGYCGINPAKIKTIWSSKYQNTLLATHEFEQRLKLIHQLKHPALLDLYVNNLDRNLYEIDSMAYRTDREGAGKQFLQFAAQHQGKVKNGNRQFEVLKNYYAFKTNLLTEAIAKTEQQIREKYEQQAYAAGQRRTTHQADSANRIQNNFTEELQVNLASAYKQLGYLQPMPNASAITTARYTVSVISTGWCNVDRYVVDATISRTSMNYTDPNTNRRAIIEYKPVTISINDAKSYDRLLVYLVPDSLSSYMNMKQVNGQFTENLNQLMSYDLVCIGFKAGKCAFLHLNAIQPKVYDALSLTVTDSTEINKTLRRIQKTDQSAGLKKEIEYAVWDLQNIALQKEKASWDGMIGELRKLLFPCFLEPEMDNENDVDYYRSTDWNMK